MTAPFTPYTYIQCPCSDTASSGTAPTRDADSGSTPGRLSEGPRETDDEDHMFDPRSAQANYSLYPLEHLLYCEDCHQIRCPRCVAEEIVTYYCPNCLFEVPTSNLKSEGNRCTRSCFQCPICVAPLSVTSLETSSTKTSSSLPESSSLHGGPYVLSCGYCQWSSSEIGIKFEKANGIYGQLAKIRNGGKERIPRDKKKLHDLASALPSESSDGREQPLGTSREEDSARTNTTETGLDLEAHYRNLKQFYQRQISETSGGGLGGLSSLSDLGFGSPASLSRIMSMYTSGLAGGSSRLDRKSQSRLPVMREAQNEDEGLVPADLNEDAAIARLHGSRSGNDKQDEHNLHNSPGGLETTASTQQRDAQPVFLGEGHLHGRARFLDELRPIPFLLRTKRSKRCPICRHIISKPEAKSTNNRFRIRLVAGNCIPSISIRPLVNPPPTSSSKTSHAIQPSNILEPLKPVQYLVTFKNPIFESVKVTLATPSTTPGRFASKVTVLCPQFEIDSNTEMWDDALRDGDRSGSGSGRHRRAEDGQPHQATAGKIWDRGRNWVTIVLEVIPPSLDLNLLAMTSKPLMGRNSGSATKVDLSPLREDEDIVEIPMFVRVEWETDAAQDGVGVGASAGKDKEGRERRELAYWCVLGIGRIRQN